MSPGVDTPQPRHHVLNWTHTNLALPLREVPVPTTLAPTLHAGRTRCLTCGHSGAADGDLSVEWLLVAATGTVTTARFCSPRCAPGGSIIDASCRTCQDGPLVLLGGTLPGMPADLADARTALTHLHGLGWHGGDLDDLICPDCA